MGNGINVLSLFDGMSCGQIALERLNVKVNNYFASEIDKHAIKVTEHNYPNTNHIGSVVDVNGSDLPKIDLLFGGSPCQSFSFSGKRNGMTTDTNEEILNLERYIELKNGDFKFKGQSYLFWEYVRLLKEVKPKHFLLENVVMSKKWEKVISDTLGVEPIEINSSLVSAHNRRRLYWTNIPVEQPTDLNINLRDILEPHVDGFDSNDLNKASILGRRLNAKGKRSDYDKSSPMIQCLEVRPKNTNKCNCITTVAKDNVLTPLEIGRHVDAFGKYSGKRLPFRNYTITEYCRLQTVPEKYFEGIVSDNQARRMIGNGWTVDVIKHILSGIL
jgi:site-specific DNA-cytosine methylase